MEAAAEEVAAEEVAAEAASDGAMGVAAGTAAAAVGGDGTTAVTAAAADACTKVRRLVPGVFTKVSCWNGCDHCNGSGVNWQEGKPEPLPACGRFRD